MAVSDTPALAVGLPARRDRPERLNARVLEILIALPAALLATALLLPGIGRGPTLDAAVFAVAGRSLASGGMPYVDVWDHKPPVLYIDEAIAAAVPVGTLWSRIWIVTVAASAGTLVALAALLRNDFGSRVTIGPLLAAGVPLGAFFFAQGGGLSESFAILPATLALFLVARGGGSGSYVLAGVLAALGALTSFFVAPALLATWVLAVRQRAGVRRLGSFFGAAAISVVAVASWLFLRGALPDAIDQIVTYNGIYASLHQLDDRFVVLVLASLLGAAPLVTLAAVSVAHALWRRTMGDLEIAAATWLVGWVAIVISDGNLFRHYVLAVVPPLAVLAGAGLRLLVGTRVPIRRNVGVALVGCAVAGSVVTLLSVVEPAPTELVDRAAAAIRAQTASSDRIFVWGNEPSVYLAAERDPAGRYAFQYPLTTPGYSSQQQLAALAASWERQPPVVIVDAATNPDAVGGFPLFGPRLENVWVYTDELDPLREFIRARYDVAENVGAWVIYKLRA